MGRNYYYEKIAKQRERELSQKAATRRLFDGADERPIAVKQVKRIAMRFAPTIIFLTLLLFYFLQ